MNIKFIIQLLVISACMLVITSNLVAQNTLFNYDFKSNPLSLSAQGVLPNLTVSDYVIGTGLTDLSAVGTNISHKDWTATSYSPANEQYHSLTISAHNGITVDLSSMTINYKRASATNSPNNIMIIASKDNFITNTPLYSNTEIAGNSQIKLTNVSLLNNFNISSGETAEIRFIPWTTVGTGVGALTFVQFSLDGVITAPLKEVPTAHVTNFTASLGTPDYNTVSLSWTDVPGVDGYVIKATNILPINGVPESDTLSLVRNIIAGSGNYTFTPICENTNWNYKIYPYNNSGIDILFKTDGDVPLASITTAIEPNVEPVTVSVGLLVPNNTDNQWVKGYVRGFVQTSDPYTVYIDPTVEQIQELLLGVNMSLLLAESKSETNIANMFYVKLSDNYIRTKLNMKNNPENLDKLYAIKGKVVDNVVPFGTYKGFSTITSYRVLTDGLTSTSNNFNNSLKIYAAMSNINIEGISVESKIHVYTIAGQMIQSKLVSTDFVQLENISAGAYILVVANELGSDTFKVLVK